MVRPARADGEHGFGTRPLLHSEGRRGGLAAIDYAALVLFVGLAAVGSTVPVSPATNATDATATTAATNAPTTTATASPGTGERTTASNDDATPTRSTERPSSAGPLRTPAASGTSGTSGAPGTAMPASAATATAPATTATASPVGTDAPTASGPGRVATVTRVVDDDTIEVRFRNGVTDTVRLLGVDAPETTLSRVDPPEYEGVPDTSGGRGWLYRWGKEADQFASAELAGETVRVATDRRADRRGSFGRLLAYVYRDGRNFNRRLFAEGYARLYESPFSKRTAFADAEARARRVGVGLWGFDGPSASATATTTRTTDSGSEGSGVGNGSTGGGPDEYDCGDFDSRAEAQRILEGEPSDPAGLDGDGDGVACESLPGNGAAITGTTPTATTTATVTTPTEVNTETPTATITATPTVEPTTGEPDAGDDLPPLSEGSDDPCDCGDFDSQARAQEYYDDEPGDLSGLDADDDGEACESLD